MDGKSKDVNQLYKEMEEAVAQKVRETMELADARRLAVAQGTLTRKEIASYIENIKSKSPQISETTRKSITASDDKVQSDNKYYTVNNSNENKDVMETQEIVIGEQLKTEQEAPTEINGTNAEENNGVPANKSEDVQIGFERFETATHPNQIIEETRIDYPLYENVRSDRLETTPSLDGQKIGFQHFEEHSQNQPTGELEENKLELAQGALNLAQNAVRNTEIWSQDVAVAKEHNQLQDAPNFTHPGRNNNNNPFEIDSNEDLRRVGENALLLAENAAKGFATNPFETSDDEAEVKKLREYATQISQNQPKDASTNPFDVVEDQAEMKRLGEEALNLAQTGFNNCVRNPFESVEDEDQEGMMQLGANALSIAQTGAKKIEAVTRQLSENSEDIDNAFNSLLDSEELKEPLIQIGFDSIEEEIEKTGGKN